MNEKGIKLEKYLVLARELKKTVECLGNIDTNCCWVFWNASLKVWKRDSLNWRLEEELKPFR